MERLIFIFALCAISFGYGVVTMQYEVFPFRVLKEAKLGVEAWAGVDRKNLNFPKAFEKFEQGAAPQPQAKQLEGNAGDEYVLITGGPYQLMERCPRYGCMAWITDRSGKIVHTWEVNLDELWSGLEGIAGEANRLSLYPVGMALGKDGSLVVSFQGRETYPVHIGIMKADRDGKLLWKRFDRSHHWLTTDEAGQIYTPFGSYVKDLKHIAGSGVTVKCATGQSGVDGIRVLSPEGKTVRELTLLDNFVRAGYSGLFYAVRDGCNLTHLNSVALASASVAKALPGAAVGDLLVSLRETSSVALLDGKTAAVKYMVAGRTAAQHGAQFLPDGTVIALDNLGGDRKLGGTRIVRINLVNGTSETVFPKGDEKDLLPVFTDTAGQIDVSPDGKRALLAVTHQGRVIEIDVASGKPLWRYDNTHDIAKFLASADIRAETTRARFATYGAYYVDKTRIDFVKEPK